VSEIEQLAHLQELDTRIDERQHRIDAIRAQLGASEELKSARAAFEQAKTSLERLEKRQRDLEWDASDRSAKIAELEKKLYSGTIRNPKELSGLQTEIEHMKAALSGVEDRTLEAMAQVDEARASERRPPVDDEHVVAEDPAARERELGAVQTRWGADQLSLKQEGQGLTSALAGLRAQRESAAAGTAPSLLARYDELRRTKRGLAVARVDRNVCLGCRTSVPTAQVQSARQGHLVYCSSCGRILYVGR
jgi:predicted  nucleic acid-binding Zn-ribbon protein